MDDAVPGNLRSGVQLYIAGPRKALAEWSSEEIVGDLEPPVGRQDETFAVVPNAQPVQLRVGGSVGVAVLNSVAATVPGMSGWMPPARRRRSKKSASGADQIRPGQIQPSSQARCAAACREFAPSFAMADDR